MRLTSNTHRSLTNIEPGRIEKCDHNSNDNFFGYILGTDISSCNLTRPRTSVHRCLKAMLNVLDSDCGSSRVSIRFLRMRVLWRHRRHHKAWFCKVMIRYSQLLLERAGTPRTRSPFVIYTEHFVIASCFVVLNVSPECHTTQFSDRPVNFVRERTHRTKQRPYLTICQFAIDELTQTEKE